MVSTGTLVAYAFKVVFGNGDILTALSAWAIFLTLLFISIAIYKSAR
ncbi:hypothetical protein GGR02_001405 [Anoxybacillus voinovskiensis]|uniref:Uncharacterized protein n=1 Tax=Anoxybacteroides voinovskiense TaxID=230470 RepID=A0A840DPN3_9BACL|nr:hypothetical protein [Anoxybacillus voinovskiensis]MBB4073643.1 hypothetical protein [Anoxybacillus voinovskiensis]